MSFLCPISILLHITFFYLYLFTHSLFLFSFFPPQCSVLQTDCSNCGHSEVSVPDLHPHQHPEPCAVCRPRWNRKDISGGKHLVQARQGLLQHTDSQHVCSGDCFEIKYALSGNTLGWEDTKLCPKMVKIIMKGKSSWTSPQNLTCFSPTNAYNAFYLI